MNSSRYNEAYQLIDTMIWLGRIIRLLGLGLSGVIFLVGIYKLCTFFNHWGNSSQEAILLFVASIGMAVVSISIQFLFSVLAQMLRAILDTAVNTGQASE